MNGGKVYGSCDGIDGSELDGGGVDGGICRNGGCGVDGYGGYRKGGRWYGKPAFPVPDIVF